MAVFVTGCGILGCWIVKGLVSQGEEVILYDMRPPQIDQETVQKITFIQGDILDYPRLVEIFHDRGSKIEGIIHTAGITSYFFLNNPHKNVTINIVGTLNILEVARIFKTKKIVYTSSCAVYGDLEGPSESKTPINPCNLYASSKASGELLGLQYANHWGIDFRVARLYSLYGPPLVPSNFIMKTKVLFGPLEGLDNLRLESGGDHQGDLTYVKDAAEGVLLLYQAEHLKNRVFNITGGRAYTCREVIEIVKKYSRATDIEMGPGYLSLPRCFEIDISRAREELGFEPKYTLERGVSEYAEWFKKGKPTQ
jgi:nucleoside-diphosphate-sugar epimerase